MKLRNINGKYIVEGRTKENKVEGRTEASEKYV